MAGRNERAEIDLIINGQSATANIRDIEAAVRKLRAELRGMQADDEGIAAKKKRYEELNNELNTSKINAGLTKAAYVALTGSLDDLQNQANEAGRALAAMKPDDPELNNAIIKYQTLNKTLDEQRAKLFANQGVVNNQKSSYNGLSNSVNQLSREMPAFANSVQTGFMAISNNLPIFVDEINRLKQANVELAAQGQPTKNIMQQVAASIFSWGTAISVGITLLTVYGKEIVTFVGELIRGKQPLDELTMRTNAFNEAIKSTELKGVVSGLAEMSTNIKLAQRGLLDKNEVLKIYNENLGKTFGHATDLNQAEQLMVQKGPAVIEMMFKKAVAAAAIEEASKKSLEAQKESLKASSESISWMEKIELTSFMMGVDERNKALARAGEKAKAEKIKTAQDESKQLLKIAEQFQTEAAQLAAKNNIDYFGGKDKNKTTKTKKVKDTSFDAELEAIIAQEETKSKIYFTEEEKRQNRERELAKQRVQVQQEYNRMVLTDKEAAEKEYLEKVKEIEAELIDTKSKAATKELELERKKNAEKLALLRDITSLTTSIIGNLNNYIQSEENAAASRARKHDNEERKRLKKQLDDKVISKEQYDRELQNLDDLAEKRQRELQKQQAERQKLFAVFESTLKAAVAWVEAYINPALIPQAIAATIQAGVVAALPVPEFFEGGFTGKGGNLDDRGGFMAVLHPNEYVVNAQALQNPMVNQMVRAIEAGTINNVTNNSYNNSTNVAGNSAKLEQLLTDLLTNGVKAEMVFNDERLLKLKKEQYKQQQKDKLLSV